MSKKNRKIQPSNANVESTDPVLETGENLQEVVQEATQEVKREFDKELYSLFVQAIDDPSEQNKNALYEKLNELQILKQEFPEIEEFLGDGLFYSYAMANIEVIGFKSHLKNELNKHSGEYMLPKFDKLYEEQIKNSFKEIIAKEADMNNEEKLNQEAEATSNDDLLAEEINKTTETVEVKVVEPEEETSEPEDDYPEAKDEINSKGAPMKKESNWAVTAAKVVIGVGAVAGAAYFGWKWFKNGGSSSYTG